MILDFTQLSKFPFNETIREAQDGDTDATRRICRAVEPIINQVCSVPYFTDHLGKEDARSIAVLALLEFLDDYRGQTPDSEMPQLIKHVVKCAVLQQVHRQETHRRRDVHVAEQEDDEASSDGAVTWNRFAAPPADEPEQNLLLQERSGQIQDAMEQLTPRERDVILSLYFERKSIDETANAFHCTRQAVSKVKRKALGKLRRRLRRAVM